MGQRKSEMRKRRYNSSVRDAAAVEKRDRVLRAAAALLRKDVGFSLDAVAKAAGVTRLTVYNHFGSRRGLLEAVFDEIARQGGLERIEQALVIKDPRAALDRLVEIFCDFWSNDSAVGRLHEAMSIDAEFAQALIKRNERRRGILRLLIGRIANKNGAPRACKDATDMIFALTSYAMFAMLRSKRSAEAVCDLIKCACNNVLEGLSSDANRRTRS
jgi:AcrR family transcriptional regulator